MKFLNRLRGRGRYFVSRGDHWFLLAVIGTIVAIAAVVMIY
ncbi:MAG TPA: hypothetical protein VF662_01065 [Allosphingosinicella sp.]|jgi:hypothetical protein